LSENLLVEKMNILEKEKEKEKKRDGSFGFEGLKVKEKIRFLFDG